MSGGGETEREHRCTVKKKKGQGFATVGTTTKTSPLFFCVCVCVLHTAGLISHFDAVTCLKWCVTGEKRVSIGLRVVAVVMNGQRESWLVRGDLPIDKLSISDEWVVR